MNAIAILARRPPALPILCGLWVIVVAGLIALDPGAFALSTVTIVLQFSTLLALVALGQTLVVLCGGAGIDLSVGGATSFSAVLRCWPSKAGMPGLLVPLVCIACGAFLGVVNGFLVTRLRILPLIATLGTYYVYSGLALSLTGGGAQSGVPV